MVQPTTRPSSVKRHRWKQGLVGLALLVALAITQVLAIDVGAQLAGYGTEPTADQPPENSAPQVNWSCRSNCA